MNKNKAALESRSVSRAPIRNEEEWVIVGNCFGPIAIPKSEVDAFYRGSRVFLVWGLVAAVLLASVVALFA
ncbi:hypothetical protein C7T35_10175 [Variovorax sp. WS11]|uniref:hypothetical protein n=1 Tax=Variovorax sp. WS11 TaxID=1105204 RepID=UPI000D0CA2ED|nr:hypothetical protein [Variovorax sp. WS11]NDZ12717.1 hypothetical protein [Variovorax sp. WS11]PSL84659.1 hypothetical protein C7T35_10175 [Variovorax sp. WS11]